MSPRIYQRPGDANLNSRHEGDAYCRTCGEDTKSRPSQQTRIITIYRKGPPVLSGAFLSLHTPKHKSPQRTAYPLGLAKYTFTCRPPFFSVAAASAACAHSAALSGSPPCSMRRAAALAAAYQLDQPAHRTSTCSRARRRRRQKARPSRCGSGASPTSRCSPTAGPGFASSPWRARWARRTRLCLLLQCSMCNYSANPSRFLRYWLG